MPNTVGAGFSIGKINKWLFACDVSYGEWSKFVAFGENKGFNDNLNYNIGGMYYIGKYAFNMGLRYNDSYLKINDTDIDEYGIAFGVSLPLRAISGANKSSSVLDLGFEYIRRGTTKNQMIQHDYFKINMAISFSNTWFQRTKFL